MTDDPLDAMWARWNHIQSSLFPWLREEVEPMTELLGRLITILDVIGLQAFVPEPPRGRGRPPESRGAGVLVGRGARRFPPNRPFLAPLPSSRKAICPTECTRRLSNARSADASLASSRATPPKS